MFFGLMNSPTTFQTMMNNIFQDLIAEGVVCIYLADILIFTKTLLEHRNIVRKVLEHLQEHKLYLKPERCEFEWKWIEYLKVIVSEGLVEMDPFKVSGIAEWPVPWNKKEVQSFVGLSTSTGGSLRTSPTMLVPCLTSPRRMSDGSGKSQNRLPLTS